jgi:hypothetical protein
MCLHAHIHSLRQPEDAATVTGKIEAYSYGHRSLVFGVGV